MDIVKSFNIKRPILLLKTLQDGKLAIIDSHNALRIIDPATFSVVGGFKSSIEHDRIVGSHVDVSDDGKFSVSVIPGTNKAALFSVAKKELMYKTGRHTGEIESVAIDSQNRYCVTCGQDGKGFLWVLKTARLAFTLPSHADYVTAVCFDDNGQWIATGSFDRTINVLNLSTMKNPVRLSAHTSVIKKIIFLNEARLVSVDKDGNVIVWDLRTGRIIKRMSKMNDEVTTMAVSADKRFLFIGTKLGYIGLYSMDTLEQIKHRYIKERESITSMAFLADPFRLAVGTAEGNVNVYSLFGNEQALMEMLRIRSYKAFYAAVEDNPLIQYSKPYALAEKVWSDVVNKARVFLEKGEKGKAKELFNLFSGITNKAAFIAQMLQSYEKYAQFRTYVQEERYSLAYSLAKQYPAFQETDPYRFMEVRWKKSFAKAQEMIVQPGGEEAARQLLAPYRGISDKSALLQQMFEQRRMFEYFKKVISERNFVKFFELIKVHSFLKEFPEYTAVMDYADKLYVQVQKAYMEGDYATARRGSEVLSAFPDYAAEAHELSDTIRVKHLFYDAIKSNNLVNAFSYLSAYPLLYETPEAQVLERQWGAIVDQAQKFAAKGLAIETYNVFEPYQSIRDKYAAMAGVIAQAYCVQLEKALRIKAPQEHIELGVRRYIEWFGIDEAISQIFDVFKKHYPTQIDPEMLKQGSFETWAPGERIEEIADL